MTFPHESVPKVNIQEWIMMIINLLQRRRGRCSYFQQSKQHLIFFSSKPPSIHMYDQPSILNDTLLKIVNSGKYFKKKKKKGLATRQKCLGSIWKLPVLKVLVFCIEWVLYWVIINICYWKVYAKTHFVLLLIQS